MIIVSRFFSFFFFFFPPPLRFGAGFGELQSRTELILKAYGIWNSESLTPHTRARRQTGSVLIPQPSVIS